MIFEEASAVAFVLGLKDEDPEVSRLLCESPPMEELISAPCQDAVEEQHLSSPRSERHRSREEDPAPAAAPRKDARETDAKKGVASAAGAAPLSPLRFERVHVPRFAGDGVPSTRFSVAARDADTDAGGAHASADAHHDEGRRTILKRPESLPLPDEDEERAITSGIGLLLRDGGGSAGRSGRSQREILDGMRVTMYLPDTSALAVMVQRDALVYQAIQAALDAALERPAGDGGAPGGAAAADCYELRMHEGGGEPDEDFPALERRALVGHFSDGDSCEFCLRRIPGQSLPSGAGTEAKETRSGSSRGSGKATMRVMLTGLSRENAITLPIARDTRACDLLPKAMGMLLRGQRHLAEEYALHLSEKDAGRLYMIETELEGRARVYPLWQEHVEALALRRKAYADSPRPDLVARQQEGRGAHAARGDDVAEPGGEDERVAVGSFMLNDVLAAVYKEWNVVKTNRHGKRQPRVIGVDAYNIYNSLRESHTTKGVHRAERPISQVQKVTWEETDPHAFSITYRERVDETTVRYRAESAFDAAEIVAKIQYLVDRRRRLAT